MQQMPCKWPDICTCMHTQLYFVLKIYQALRVSVAVHISGSGGGEVTSQRAKPTGNQTRQAQNGKITGGESSEGGYSTNQSSYSCAVFCLLFDYFLKIFSSTFLVEESVFHPGTLSCDSCCFMGQRVGWTSLAPSSPETHAGGGWQRGRHQCWWGHNNFIHKKTS